MAIFFGLIVYIKKDVLGRSFAAEFVGGAIVKHKKSERVVVQAGNSLDKTRRTAKINIIVPFFNRKAFAQASFFLLVL
jgi:hypothetical protein